jgi:hypothetical protein
VVGAAGAGAGAGASGSGSMEGTVIGSWHLQALAGSNSGSLGSSL